MKFLLLFPLREKGNKETFPVAIKQRIQESASEVTTARNWQSALEYRAIESFNAVWADWRLIGDDYQQFHRRLRRLNPHTPLIVITGNHGVEVPLCYNYDLLFTILRIRTADENITKVIERLKSYHNLLNNIPKEIKSYLRPSGFGPFIGNSYAMLEIYRQIAKVAATDFTVLILGESGSGKELVAKTIHELSSRKREPFISVNCAAIPENLLESELFGYEKGAFTGANQFKPGKFELADRGTLFMDEIGEMALPLQAKLLRVLEDNIIERLGSTKGKKINIRLLTATNRDLQTLVKEGSFRSDLHYRMNVIPIQLSALSNRQEDIILLSLHLLNSLLKNRPGSIDKINWNLFETLAELPISGNVRELDNILTRIVFLTEGKVLSSEQLENTISLNSHREEVIPENTKEIVPLWKTEKQSIEMALEKMDGNITKVASMLEISRVTLYRKMKKYGIHLEDQA